MQSILNNHQIRSNSRYHAADSNHSKYSYLIVAVVLVAIWVTWTSLWDSGLYGDSVEQFIWSHSLELGYYKHPPLPTWLLSAAIHLFGPAWWLASALAATCVAETGVFTWLIARRIADQNVANITAVLWGLQQCFSVSAEIYNHNTSLVLWVAATTYCLIRALDSNSHWRWWAATGALAACAMLSKYQAALPLAFLTVAALVISRQRGLKITARLLLALAFFLALLAPHIYWGISNHFPSLRYASAAIEESGGFSKRLFWIATFAINQIRMNLPLIGSLLVSALLAAIWRPVQAEPTFNVTESADPQQPVTVWMWTLLWGPIAVLLVLSVLTGSQLRNHWGVQLFQFLPLWVAWTWRKQRFLDAKYLLIAAALMHGLGFTYYAFRQSAPYAVLAERRADSAYPAQKMSAAAVAHWRAATHCPLRIVAGDFEAGLVSAYSAEFPAVFISTSATPWVTEATQEKHGVLYVFDSTVVLPAAVVSESNWTIGTFKDGTKKYVQFAVRLPASSCVAMSADQKNVSTE